MSSMPGEAPSQTNPQAQILAQKQEDWLIDPPLVELDINTHDHGFYDGFSRAVTIPSKVIISLLIMWAIFFPVNANKTLGAANSTIIATFGGWYVYLIASLIVTCLVLTLVSATGSLRIGPPGEKPEFNRLSWFSMLFGAGIGIGMLTYSTGEPLAHFLNNPDIIRGLAEPQSLEAVRPAYMYTFLHWGLGAWCTYALVGLAIAYVAHRRDLPLTIRSALAPLFGKVMEGPSGHVVDIVAVVATILGVAVTMGLGVEQFVAGLARMGLGDWLLADDGSASSLAIIASLVMLVGASTISALSGVGRGDQVAVKPQHGTVGRVAGAVRGAGCRALRTAIAGHWPVGLPWHPTATIA